ncbi:riboflavin synthase [Candidatus Spongiihabitans sp.]|uniref:riboflavin synthase n=1 Tax=Candidatus Spongiihabitans sp. TaxID=3101308 RepID=UPI003C6ED020
MFTGIIQSVGSVTAISSASNGARLSINLKQLDLERICLGDSIAVNGACLTINRLEQNIVHFDVSSETLATCLMGDWQAGDRINLELALTLQTPIGGHLLSGHIDGTAKLVNRQDGSGFAVMRFETERAIGKFIAVKGSVAIDGVSLTTNKVADSNHRTQFEIMLVAHTLERTTLGKLEKNSRVHVEVDQVARYIQRLSECAENQDVEPI